MTIKEQESQLSLNLNLRIVVSIMAFLLFTGFVVYRLYMATKIPNVIETTSNTTVPLLKLEDFETLRRSLKIPFSVTPSALVRPEPFD